MAAARASRSSTFSANLPDTPPSPSFTRSPTITLTLSPPPATPSAGSAASPSTVGLLNITAIFGLPAFAYASASRSRSVAFRVVLAPPDSIRSRALSVNGASFRAIAPSRASTGTASIPI
jgi:hypothetical protein